MQVFLSYKNANMLRSVTRLRKKLLGYYIWHRVKYLEMRVFSDPYFPIYGRFCPYTGEHRSEKVNISGYFTHCESKNKNLYKILDANSKMVIPYKWLLHSILRICTVQRLSQLNIAWQKHILFLSCGHPHIYFSQPFSF